MCELNLKAGAISLTFLKLHAIVETKQTDETVFTVVENILALASRVCLAALIGGGHFPLEGHPYIFFLCVFLYPLGGGERT